MEFIIKQTDEILVFVSHSGLALIGAMLEGLPLRKRLNDISLGKRRRPDVPHGDVLTAMVGLLQAVPGTKLYQRLNIQGRLLGHTTGTNVDGTTNFTLGLQTWGVSIARLVNGFPDTAALYFPLHGELYSAQRGAGAHQRGP